MPNGTPVGRQWLLMLRDGRVVIDWGNDLFQDIASGDFLRVSESEISHIAQDTDLSWLKLSGCIVSFNEKQAFIANLPERPAKPIA